MNTHIFLRSKLLKQTIHHAGLFFNHYSGKVDGKRVFVIFPRKNP